MAKNPPSQSTEDNVPWWAIALTVIGGVGVAAILADKLISPPSPRCWSCHREVTTGIARCPHCGVGFTWPEAQI